MSAAPRTRRGLLFLVFLCLFPWAGQSAPLPDHHEWTRDGGFRQAALAAGGDSDEYADDAEAARDVMRVLSECIDAVIAQKLKAPLGERVAKAKPKRAESWRSGRSMRNIVLNIESIRALVETSGGFADLVTAHGESELAEDLRMGLADAASSGPVTEWVRTRFGCSARGRGSRWPTAGSAPTPTPAARS